MNSVNIQERRLTGSGAVCRTGTTPTSSQNYLCVGAWVPRDFADTLSANSYTGSSLFTQMFWAETQPNTPGYKPFNGQIKIDAYKPRRVSSTLRHPAWEFTDFLSLSVCRVKSAD